MCSSAHEGCCQAFEEKGIKKQGAGTDLNTPVASVGDMNVQETKVHNKEKKTNDQLHFINKKPYGMFIMFQLMIYDVHVLYVYDS